MEKEEKKKKYFVSEGPLLKKSRIELFCVLSIFCFISFIYIVIKIEGLVKKEKLSAKIYESSIKSVVDYCNLNYVDSFIKRKAKEMDIKKYEEGDGNK